MNRLARADLQLAVAGARCAGFLAAVIRYLPSEFQELARACAAEHDAAVAECRQALNESRNQEGA